jgi:hypothetical protein
MAGFSFSLVLGFGTPKSHAKKVPIVDSLRMYQTPLRFIKVHPICGAESAGLEITSIPVIADAAWAATSRSRAQGGRGLNRERIGV